MGQGGWGVARRPAAAPPCTHPTDCAAPRPTSSAPAGLPRGRAQRAGGCAIDPRRSPPRPSAPRRASARTCTTCWWPPTWRGAASTCRAWRWWSTTTWRTRLSSTRTGGWVLWVCRLCCLGAAAVRWLVRRAALQPRPRPLACRPALPPPPRPHAPLPPAPTLAPRPVPPPRRIGRTGRAGRKGTAVTLLTLGDTGGWVAGRVPQGAFFQGGRFLRPLLAGAAGWYRCRRCPHGPPPPPPPPQGSTPQAPVDRTPVLPRLPPRPPRSPPAEVFYDLKKFLEESKAAVPAQLASHEAARTKPGAIGQGRPAIQFAKK